MGSAIKCGTDKWINARGGFENVLMWFSCGDRMVLKWFRCGFHVVMAQV